MVTAVVLLNVQTDLVNETAEELCKISGVSEVYSVAGRHDLVALVRVQDNDALARVVSEEIRKLRGITTSETLIAFRAYNRADIEAGFALGTDS